MNLSQWITQHARHTPDKAALHFEGRDIGYAALATRIDETAAALAARRIGQGDVVAWLGMNSPAMLATLFACARLGAIFMPLNWRLAPPEHQALLRDDPPALLFVDAPFVAASAAAPIVPAATACVALGAAAPSGWLDGTDFAPPLHAALSAAQGSADAPLLLCYTSGSTGRAKGVVLTQKALVCNAANSVDMHGLTQDDRVLTTLPLFHVGGLNIQTLPALQAGCTVTLHAKFDADATFDAIERQRITLTVLVPAQLDAMLSHPRWANADFGSLRMISTGSTQVPMRIIQAVHARGLPLIQVWGATETAPIAACLHADEALRKAGSTGRAAQHGALRIVDVDGRDLPPGKPGEVLARGDNLMSGYWRDPESSARALAGGWFHSGDMGHLDDEGFLYIDGRLKDMIISGGENVSPTEVEAVLLEHPQVAEAAVVGRADERWGEVIIAVVALQPGSTLTREQLLGMCEGRIARFKHPKDVLFVDAMPRTALGKVRKEDVRRLVAEAAAAAGATPTPQERMA